MPITFVNHTPVQMNSNIISCPSGTKVGDTIIIAYHCICSNNAIESPEFTREQNEGVILYKKAISSDIGANFTISKTAEKFWIVAITIRGAKFHSSKAAYCLRYNCHEVYPPVAGRPWFGICLSYIPQKLEIHNGWNIIRGDDPSESRDIDFFHRITEGTCITPIFVHGPGNLYSKVGVFQFAEDEPKAPFNLIPSGTSSTAPTKVETLTPKITWSFSNADGDNQSAYQVIIREGATEVDNSGKVTNSNPSYTVPANKLRSNTTYNYTVKVWGQADIASPDSTVQYFKTTQAPTATPLSTSTTPAGDIKLSWNYNDAERHLQEKFQVKIYNAEEDEMVLDITKTSSKTFFDLPSSELTAGKEYYWTLQVWDITGMKSNVTAPQYFKTNQAPNAPIDLSPAGPSTNPVKVPTLTPTITWRFTDPDGDRQSAYQVIIREGAVEVDNSGKVTNSTSSYTVPANKLRSNTNYNYTVKVWDQTDEVSQDSAVQYFQTRQAPNAPIDLSPAGPSTNPMKVQTLTPNITWKFTDPDGDRQSAYQVIIREGAVEVDNSGKVTNNTPSYTVPANKLRSNTTYNYTVKVWDQT
ncbi:hypothetical protein, partial [Brevibacillus sp. SYSU BS000544]|uniref:glycoside hydrolase family 78 protein n=1 Tax=Brevibacillus sp. SYSU BS000544 TaxID=3416443 RepID=UPI003CE4B12E